MFMNCCERTFSVRTYISILKFVVFVTNDFKSIVYSLVSLLFIPTYKLDEHKIMQKNDQFFDSH